MSAHLVHPWISRNQLREICGFLHLDHIDGQLQARKTGNVRFQQPLAVILADLFPGHAVGKSPVSRLEPARRAAMPK